MIRLYAKILSMSQLIIANGFKLQYASQWKHQEQPWLYLHCIITNLVKNICKLRIPIKRQEDKIHHHTGFV